MKKLFLMVVAAFMATTSINAQSAGEVYIKPTVGGTLTTVTNHSEAKMKLGLVGGFELGYNFSENFGVTLGALYTMQGAKNDDGDKASYDYINFPLLANVYVTKGLAIKAGPQIGFLTKAKSEDIDIKSLCNKVDISIPVGLSYEISDFVIDARYNFGVTKIFKSHADGWNIDSNDARNSVIMLTVGYKIPL